MDAARLAKQIAAAEAQLDQLADAIASLADPTVKTYSLDDGQTTQRVERNTLRDLIDSNSALMNQLTMLEVLQKGNGATIAVPAW